MPSHTSVPPPLTSLRQRAAQRLGVHDAESGAAGRASTALSVLHGLASSPSTADDALALLHELQVHQVELDLQAQDLQESRVELEADLLRATLLFEHMPAGCFSIDRQFIVRELNRAAAKLFGIEPAAAPGLRLETVIGTDASVGLKALTERCGAGRPSAGAVRWRDSRGLELACRAQVGMDAAGQGFLVTMMLD